jgi:pimeloyl-ACP methyl ester carboxylesterase
MQLELSTEASTLSYDRPGVGHSELSPVPRHSSNMSLECHALIMKQKMKLPVVLVTHGYGSHIARMFYRRWPDMVAGMVFIDPMHERYIDDREWIGPFTEDYLKSTFYKTLSMLGLMEIYFKLSDRFDPQLDNVEKETSSKLRYFMLKTKYWQCRKLEMGELVPSSRQIMSFKDEFNVPIMIVQTEKNGGLNREIYKKDAEFNKVLLESGRNRKELIKFPNENFYSVLESRKAQNAILEFVKKIDGKK